MQKLVTKFTFHIEGNARPSLLSKSLSDQPQYARVVGISHAPCPQVQLTMCEDAGNESMQMTVNTIEKLGVMSRQRQPRKETRHCWRCSWPGNYKAHSDWRAPQSGHKPKVLLFLQSACLYLYWGMLWSWLLASGVLLRTMCLEVTGPLKTATTRPNPERTVLKEQHRTYLGHFLPSAVLQHLVNAPLRERQVTAFTVLVIDSGQ
jgi:hypothetical protein